MGLLFSMSNSSQDYTSTTDETNVAQPSISPQFVSRAYTYGFWPVTNNGALYGMVTAACVLLLFYALLAGLTLAVCGLDMTWLHMRAICGTPKQRKRALVVTNMKRKSTWMLCSLILCSVAAGETFPFIIQDLWHGRQLWAPILFSTFLVAVFAELLPQYIIPRHAINWGYYCCPLIWACMITTGLISYPLALLLDAIAGKKQDHEIFTNSEIAALVKYHEHSEKHGGDIGEDASRIMLGALQLDSRKIGGDIPPTLGRIAEEDIDAEKDLEKADPVLASGMVVRWSAVKTIDIDEAVDGNFIRKVKSWSYSRIPVIGGQAENSDLRTTWEGKHIYGFLHIKNLLGLIDEKHDTETCIFVRDLPLYPLPIIQEHMSVYELLNIFQLGMSRMAVIVSKLPSSSTEPTIGSSNSSPQPGIPHWTATQSTNARIIYRMKTAESQVDWTSDWAANFLRASQMDIKRPGSLKQNVVGFESPAPIGIITFEDIIDTILQKPSRDERAFFSVNQVLSLKSINGNLIYPACGGHPRVTSGILPSFKDVVQDSLLGSAKEIKKVQRKSSVSGANDIIGGIDGGDMSSARMVNTGNIDDCVHVSKFRRNFVSHQKTDYRKVFTAGMDGVDDRNEHKGMKIIILPRRGSSRGSSSYTEDRQGGFHVSRRIPWNNPKLEISEEREAVTAAIGLNVSPKVSSLPYRRGFSSLLSDGVETLWRNVSATHALPRPGCATTSSNGRLSTFERSAVDVKDSSDLSFPLAPASESLVNTNPQAIYDASGIDIDENNSGGLEEAVDDTHNKSGSAISVSSWNYADLLAAQNGNQHLRATCGLRLASVTFPVISSKKDEPTTVPSNSGVTLSDDRYSQAPEQDYTGFPSELLGTINLSREKSVPDYASKTLPRKVELTANPIDFDNIEPGNAQEVQIGYDDEAPIPIYGSTVKDGIINGARSSSFWL